MGEGQGFHGTKRECFELAQRVADQTPGNDINVARAALEILSAYVREMRDRSQEFDGIIARFGLKNQHEVQLCLGEAQRRSISGSTALPEWSRLLAMRREAAIARGVNPHMAWRVNYGYSERWGYVRSFGTCHASESPAPP